jgi:hypothetical protein
MRYDLSDKSVLITGASSGIGHSTARALARKGARLAIASRGKVSLERLASQIEEEGGRRPVVLTADLSRRGNASELGGRAVEALGHVDVLINNAGVGLGGAQCSVGDDDAGRELFETNLWSPLALVRALAPAMRERGSGVVVNVTSMAAVAPFVLTGHYAASKAALTLATDTLRMELHGTGVHVLSVLPGPVATNMLTEAKEIPGMNGLLDLVPQGDPDELARLVVRAMERRREEIVYPRPLWFARTFPSITRLVWPLMNRKLDGNDTRVVKGGFLNAGGPGPAA